jgi:UDP-GlcNAc:undecaprenyl-phosphate/decaprenyl-phosphate GlcNAc-1-phosphate transferase
MLQIIEIGIVGLVSFILTLFIIPAIKKIAIRSNLVDKPGKRKVHLQPVPLIGGISITISVFLAMMVSPSFLQEILNYRIIFSTAFLLLVVGVLDDKFDIKAKYKLFIQLACSFAIANSGIRITSLYGILGIYGIPLELQYLLTIIVIAGTVNAFNLMDGVDGLAGGLSVLGFSILAVLSFIYGDMVRTTIFLAFIGALIGFLKCNLNKDKKIFMGDAGSLVLGFLLTVFGIQTLEFSQISSLIDSSIPLFLIAGFFSVPVLDSLRVYLGRIKNGNSPFTADKSHLHHLVLMLGLTHKKITLLINSFVILLVLGAIVSALFFSQTIIFILIFLSFHLITKVLTLNKDLMTWKSKLTSLEKE